MRRRKEIKGSTIIHTFITNESTLCNYVPEALCQLDRLLFYICDHIISLYLFLIINRVSSQVCVEIFYYCYSLYIKSDTSLKYRIKIQ